MSPTRLAYCTPLGLAAILACGQVESAGDSGSPLAPLTSSLLHEEWTIGLLDGPPEYVFGRITDADRDTSGRLYVLDSMNHRLRVFDSAGVHVVSAGREGNGPGEFIASYRFTLDRDGFVVVADRSGRLTNFAFGDSVLEYRGVTTLTYGAFDICSLEQGLLVHGFAVGDTVSLHWHDREGERVSPFGAFHAGETLIARETFSSGYVVCYPEIERVLYVTEHSPEVRAYTPEGVLVWTDSIPLFRQVQSHTRADFPGYTGFRWVTPEGTHRIVSAIPAGRGGALVQVAMRDTTSTSARDYQALETFLWDVATGELLDQASEIPEIIVLGEGTAVGVEHEPYPRLTKYRAPDWSQ